MPVTQTFTVDHNLFKSGEKSATSGSNAVMSAADPFVNRAGKDFHLSSASPARNMGQAIADIATDLDGKPRPAGATDAGAYQYSETASPPPSGNPPKEKP